MIDYALAHRVAILRLVAAAGQSQNQEESGGNSHISIIASECAGYNSRKGLMYFTRIAWLALAVLAAAGIAAAQVTLSGRVVDENEAPVAGARVAAHLGGQNTGVLPRRH